MGHLIKKQFLQFCLRHESTQSLINEQNDNGIHMTLWPHEGFFGKKMHTAIYA